MRFATITLVLALPFAGSFGCGGAGTSSDSGATQFDSASYDPHSDYQPAGGEDKGSSGYDTPDSTYDSQPGADNPGSFGPSDPSLCPRLCEVVTSLACLVDDPSAALPTPSECQSACVAQAAEISAQKCLNESVNLLACFFDQHVLDCDLLGKAENDQLSDDDLQQLGDGALNACNSALSALTQCTRVEMQPQPPDNGGGRCSLPNCNNCQDQCELCACLNDGDTSGCGTCGT